jgi:hypothetical protein
MTGVFGGFATIEMETGYNKALFFLVYSLQSSLA